MPRAFLMQQMAWREALDEAGSDAAAVESLDDAVQADERGLLATLGQTLDAADADADADADAGADATAQAQAAAQQVRALMFVARFRADIGRRLEALDT